MCRRARGEPTARTTISFWQGDNSNNELSRKRQKRQRNKVCAGLAEPRGKPLERFLQFLGAPKQWFARLPLCNAKRSQRLEGGRNFRVKKFDGMSELLLDCLEQFGTFGGHLLTVGLDDFLSLR